MRSHLSVARSIVWSSIAFAAVAACSATQDDDRENSAAATSGTGGGLDCGTCVGTEYTPCDGPPVACALGCTPGVGCTNCPPSGTMCVGNDVHECEGDGTPGDLVETCDVANGELCSNGVCQNGCQLAADAPSNMGCEFYAVDLDLSDGVSDPGAGPWGVALANAGQAPATVTIEQNDAPVGMPPSPIIVYQATVNPGDLAQVTMPTREVDCAATPGDWGSPGSCLSSNAYRITSSSPIVVYQFNNFVHGYSTDASLLLPVTSVGTKYRVTGWPVSHSFPSPGAFVQRGYVTIVGTVADTHVTVKPSWRIKGNGAVPATAAGGTLQMTLGPYDVLNLETDDATMSECLQMQTPPYCADLTGTAIEADQPVIVFSGTEESGVGLPEGAPMPPSWNPETSNGCCNQHLEEQLAPVESFGTKFLVTRSPLRSNAEFTWWEEPDVLRFVGAAEPAQVTTNLPAPFDSFTLQPGEVKDTWTQTDIVVVASQPIEVAQFLIGEGYVEPQPKGDPSFTIFPPVEQARSEYVFLSPSEWKENWVVIGAEVGIEVQLDGASPSGCTAHDAGTIDGKSYEARRCPLAAGVHRMSGSAPFQIMAYGYSDADAYSFPGGANIKKIYEPPPIK